MDISKKSNGKEGEREFSVPWNVHWWLFVYWHFNIKYSISFIGPQHFSEIANLRSTSLLVHTMEQGKKMQIMQTEWTMSVSCFYWELTSNHSRKYCSASKPVASWIWKSSVLWSRGNHARTPYGTVWCSVIGTSQTARRSKFYSFLKPGTFSSHSNDVFLPVVHSKIY